MGMTVGKGKKRRVPWRGAAGLADDIRYYGRWMREEAFKRIGHLYPQVKLPDGSECHCNCVAVGAHRALSESGVSHCHAADGHVSTVEEERQRTLD